MQGLVLWVLKQLTHPRTGFIIRRIKSLFHHSNWQHIFLISFNGTSKRGVMRYNKKIKKIIWFFGQTLPICMKIVEFQSLKALPIWRFLDHFSLEKSCDRLVHWTVINIGSNGRGNFSLSVELSSFIFLLLYHELWVMIRNVHVLWTLCVDGLTNGVLWNGKFITKIDWYAHYSRQSRG